MKNLKEFEEFVKEGVIDKRSSDKSRAKYLFEEAQRRHKFLKEMCKKIGLSDENANYFIENSYDILIELIRAKLLIEGYHSSGQGAHEAEVSYMRKLNFLEKDVRFMNNLRYFRNGIKYYGKTFDKEHGEKILKFLNKTYPELIKQNKKTI